MPSSTDQTAETQLDARALRAILKGMPAAVRKSAMARLRAFGRENRDALRATLPQRTGRLRKSVGMSFRQKENEISLKLFANKAKAPHAGVIEHGGAIRPKQASMLAIPITGSPAADGHGQARFSARELKENPEAFGYQSSFVHGDVIMGKTPDGQTHLLFALKPEVIIPRSQGGYFKRFKEAAQPGFREAVIEAIGEGLQAAADEARSAQDGV